MLRKLLGLGFVLAIYALAGEGMWLFDHFPKEQVFKTYGLTVTDDFLRHLERASVRFNNGGSGSFVSPHGLLFTNHHVGMDCIQKLSSADHDYMANGFSAATEAGEKACPDLEVDALLSTGDITSKVNEGIGAQTSNADANRLRKAAMAKIEKECSTSTGDRCDVVTLYSGGEYSLYRYRKYTDIRLVFAPEFSIAQFGGDPDNFTYPRYCLDFALFRAYEKGQPVTPADHLRWSHQGVKDGELTFAQSAENKPVAQDELDLDQNSFKELAGFEQGLKGPKLMARKEEDEQKLRAAIDSDPAKKKKSGELWDEISKAYQEYATFFKPYYLLEAAPANADLFIIGRSVVRYGEETHKPNGQRLREYQHAGLESLSQQMYSAAPINNGLQQLLLATLFRFEQSELGADNPTVKAVLAGRTPEDAAHYYVSTSKIQDVAERKRLAHDFDAVKKSQDGMIQLALILDGAARLYRKEFDDKVESVITSSAAQIAQARLAAYGTNEYPDATFTPRLTYGPVKGYLEAGNQVAWDTTFAGLYKHATGQEPFKLPSTWIEAEPSLDLNTPFDFVTTADTHGGNSGSPTVNTKGELIGILFDGNLEDIPNRYVASNAIIEALRKVYHANHEIGF